MNALMLHCGSRKVSRNDLAYVDTPNPTRSWRPVSHFDVANMVASEIGNHGLSIVNEEYGLNPSQTQMFGVLRFRQGDDEKVKCLGLRNSHNKQFALGLTVGFSVLVCDNLCFGGETTLLRRHTSGMDLESLIPEAMTRMVGGYELLSESIEHLKRSYLTIDQAKLIAVKAAERDCIPSCDIIPVLNEFQDPRHEEFGEPTRWSLHNAFTEISKKYKPARFDKCHRGLSQLFQLS